MSTSIRILCIASILSAGAILPLTAEAAGARQGVHPEHGEMVLLRSVPARHAYRTQPPGMAVIADPRPTNELNQSLGTGELSDEDFAALESGNGLSMPPRQTAVGAMVERTLGAGPLGQGAGDLTGTGARASSFGAVTGAARGIAGQVQGALSQFPLGNGGNGP